MADNPESVEDIITDMEPVTAEVWNVPLSAVLQQLSETVAIQPLTIEATT